jgi:phosphatidylglycerophosphate synthase
VKGIVIKKHMQSLCRYMFTAPNVMDYVRLVVYMFAVHGHFNHVWWSMPFAILCAGHCLDTSAPKFRLYLNFRSEFVCRFNGIIDDLDGKVARALDQCSTMGYLVDCLCDNLAVVSNTGCIAAAALQSDELGSTTKWAICIIMQLYAVFFLAWSNLATAVPDYKGNHTSRLARWYYGTAEGDAILYLGMQTFWAGLYLFAEGTYAWHGQLIASLTAPLWVLKVAVEVENVYHLIWQVMKADIDKCVAEQLKSA